MIKAIFWKGVKAFVPIALTVSIVLWLLNSFETFFGKFLKYIIPEKYYFTGFGILIGTAFIFIIGILVNAWLVGKIYAFADKIVKRIPIIKTIYNAIQDLLNFFDKSHGSEQQAVLVTTAMGKVIGLVTRDSLVGLPLEAKNEQQVLVYIPLSYMIGGLTLVVDKKDIVPLAWPAEQLMSFILTAGMTGKKA